MSEHQSETRGCAYTYNLHGLSCPNCAGRIGVGRSEESGRNRSMGLHTALVVFATGLAIFEIPTLFGGTHLLAAMGGQDWADQLLPGTLSTLMAIWVPPLIFGAACLLAGFPVFRAAVENIMKGRVFDENFLMTLAVVGAFGIGVFAEGAAVMLFYAIGEAVQERAVARSRRSIASLMDIKPDTATRITDAGRETVPAESIVPGDLIEVRSGERVPLDGTVSSGDSYVDTSALTGESVPRRIGVGDEIPSGTMNVSGLITIEVTVPFEDSTVSRILRLVEDAADRKAPTEKFITAFARIYTPVVVGAAVAIALLPPLLLPDAQFFRDISEWIYRALIFLVISCPCALVVSIPLGFFGGIGRASRQGVLVKGGNYLEALARLRRVVFDKTGTLTRGTFQVDRVVPSEGMSRESLLAFAAAAEAGSTHPIASAIRAAVGDVVPALQNQQDIRNFVESAGHGVSADVDGYRIMVGTEAFIRGSITPEDVAFNLEEDAPQESVLRESRTEVWVSVDGEPAGRMTLDDAVRPDARQAIRMLESLGIETAMVSGDTPETAARIARDLGIGSYYAGLLPDQKVQVVEDMMRELPKGKRLAFVGDGINDAPVLARSDIGIAMGGIGSDSAVEAADVVLMSDEPSKVADAITTARLTRRIVIQNIAAAFAVKGFFILLGVMGYATAWEAVFADVGVALLAVMNAVRIIPTTDSQTLKNSHRPDIRRIF